MATSVELDYVTRPKRVHNADGAAANQAVVLSETSLIDKGLQRGNQTKFPPVSRAPPIADSATQKHHHQLHVAKFSERQLRTNNAQKEPVQSGLVTMISSTSNFVRYDLPARLPVHHFNATGEQQTGSVNGSQRFGENSSTKHHPMMNGSKEKMTIFNREPVPFASGQFKFSSMVKKIPVRHQEWSHYSPLLNRYRAFVVHANRQSLKLNSYEEAATDRGNRSHTRRKCGGLESKSDYIHCSRQLQLPAVVTERNNTEFHHTPMNTMLEQDLILHDGTESVIRDKIQNQTRTMASPIVDLQQPISRGFESGREASDVSEDAIMDEIHNIDPDSAAY